MGRPISVKALKGSRTFTANTLLALILGLPILAGVAGVVLPAFGYLPALGRSEFTFNHFAELFAQPHILRSSLTGLLAGLVTTGAAVAVVGTFLAGFAGTPAFSRIQHVVSPLLAVPHASAAFALAFLVAPSGFLVRLVSPELTGFGRPPQWLVPNDPLALSMLAGLITKEVPFLFLIALAALPQLPLRQSRQLTAALGYGRLIGFLVSLWPALYRQIRLAVFAVLVYSVSVVDVAIILGPQLPATLPVRIAQWTADHDLGARFLASAAALLQLGVVLAAVAIWLLIERLGRFVLRKLTYSGRRLRNDAVPRLVSAFAMAGCAALIFLGISILGVWSVAGLWPFPRALPAELTLQTWLRTLPPLWPVLRTTTALALLSAALALFCAILLLHRNGAAERRGNVPRYRLLYLPLLLPEISFVFGLQILIISAGLKPAFWSVLAVHFLFVLPYVLLSLSAPWREVDPRFERIAAGFGKSALRTLLTVRLPLLFRACLTAYAVGFSVSVSLYLPTLLIGGGRLTTIATEAVALSSGGDRRVIGVYALVQASLPFLAFLIASLGPQLLFRNRRAMRT
ncbi:ABC transporter permease [Sinorhizobium americanum]|uniref:Binding-protein-dependent transport system inner membrane protein n=1 Tax=Sinorhizobium americanum TaxID=194963 RepID=A0A1L3LH41_9HYPH|nr:ABC transporter permease [Sinorhizobium americanum]APG82872.1 binding-protein-dependent transport system inner membrane protein [Sinorhizobium americanum CCGM7]APG89411.1 binding-protein-dependent transport system inner membrane protein [Sinorhizobium americanum]OAP49307.1 ABC transporter permease [Sinorhizobium americanum]